MITYHKSGAVKHKFNSVKSRSFGALLLIVSALLILLLLIMPTILGNPSFVYLFSVIAVMSAIVVFFTWIWLSTYYIVDSKSLEVISGPFKWTIPINQIEVIKLNQRTIEGVIKPTLSWKSIKITYNKSREISISPQNQDQFLNLIKNSKQSIEIK